MRELADPRPFKIYRNRRGGPRWYQRIVEAWWVLTRRHSLHSAWQSGHDHGSMCEYHRLITNRAYLGEVAYRESRLRAKEAE